MISETPRRFGLDGVCETPCAVCAHGLPAEPLAAHDGPLKSVVLSCQSLFSPGFASTLQDLLNEGVPVQLEVNLATASLKRWAHRLLEFKNPLFSLIIIIDQWHPQKIAALGAVDPIVSEYRVLPSKLYSSEVFARELPTFVLKKWRLAFLPALSSDSPFLSAEELYSDLISLKTTGDFAPVLLAETQYYQGVSVQVHPVGAKGVWIANPSAPLPQGELLKDLERQSERLVRGEVIWVASDKSLKLRRAIQKYRQNPKSDFYFLENSLMSHETWADFVSSPQARPLDCFSWSEHISVAGLRVQILSRDMASSAPSLNEVSRLCRRRFARRPDRGFYEDYFCLFSEKPGLRHWHLWFLKMLVGFWQRLAPSAQGRERLQTRGAQMIETLAFELGQTREAVSRFVSDRFWWGHQLAWRVYHFFWHGVYATGAKKRAYSILVYWGLRDAGWKIYHFYWHSYHAFGAWRRRASITWFWKMMDGYWWVYSTFFAPVVGFVRTLFDHPPAWNLEPWPRRLRLKSFDVAKKWAWLFLRTVRLR